MDWGKGHEEIKYIGLPARVVTAEDDSVHVVPEFEGERAHETSIGCWCGPKRDHVEPLVIIHNRVAEA